MKAQPVILHTDDHASYREFIEDDFKLFGIKVESFERNEDALQSAKEKFQEGKPFYRAVIADYNTQSQLTGVDLIAQLLKSQLGGKPLVDDILVLSSTANRSEILRDLEDSLKAQDIPLAKVEEYMGTVQVFDKLQERSAAELYVALRTLHPKESLGLKRVDLIHWLGFEVKDNGDLISRNPDALNIVTGEKFDLIRRKKLTSIKILSEINAYRREGRQFGELK